MNPNDFSPETVPGDSGVTGECALCAALGMDQSKCPFPVSGRQPALDPTPVLGDSFLTEADRAEVLSLVKALVTATRKAIVAEHLDQDGDLARFKDEERFAMTSLVFYLNSMAVK